MQSQLERLEKDFDVEWQEFRLEELFGKSTRGRRLKSVDRIHGNLPFVTAGERNSGISSLIGNDVRVFPKNTITIDMFGSAKYRNYEYGADDHVAVVYTDQLPENVGLFITSAIHKSSHAGQFDYSKNFYSSDADKLKVQLPIKTLKGKKALALDFMEEFIKLVQIERIAELKSNRNAKLEACLVSANITDYVLTDDEQSALDKLEAIAWGKFLIEDVLVWEHGIVELSPLHLDSLSISDEEKYPFYGQSTKNNGIISYRHLNDGVLNNKYGKPTILIHSNNQNIVYLETPFYLKDGHGATSVLQSEHLDEMTAQFIMSSIKKVISQKYNYNSKATKVELKNTEISLPVKSDKTPDYDFMRIVVTATQKIVVNEVISKADRVIDATVKLVRFK